MKVIKKAMKDKIICIQPSTTTYFLIQELSGQTPTWFLSGGIIPEGMGRTLRPYGRDEEATTNKERNIGGNRNHWVIRNGKLQTIHPAMEGGDTLDEILSEMGPDDCYIRSANALDAQGNVGVLIGSYTGGTMGRAMSKLQVMGCNIIYPVGLEKLIPTSVFEASRECGIKRFDYSMGMPCGLWPAGTGTVVSEPLAIEILTGAIAIPISAGGIQGAEGSISLVIKGEKHQVRKAIAIVESVKQTKLPHIDFRTVVTVRERHPERATKGDSYLPATLRGWDYPSINTGRDSRARRT
jgi:hypothetical protein